MTLPLVVDPLPLHTDRDGVIRVDGTRISLDLVVLAFKEGATADEIVERYPALSLKDVHAVIAYYLRHQAEVDAYCRDQERQADEARSLNEARFDPTGIRERLLARRCG
jgi:uncharacterized protein (DUF433 family)